MYIYIYTHRQSHYVLHITLGTTFHQLVIPSPKTAMSSHQSCGIDLENGAHCMVVTTTISQIRYSNYRAPQDFQHEHGQKTLLQPHLTGGNQR